MRHGRPHRLRARLAAIAALVLAGFATQFTLTSDLQLWPAWVAPADPDLVTPVDPVAPATASDDDDGTRREHARSGPVRSLTSDASCDRWLRAPGDVRRRFLRWVGWRPALVARGNGAVRRICLAAAARDRRRLRPASRSFQLRVARTMVRHGRLDARDACRLRPLTRECRRANRTRRHGGVAGGAPAHSGSTWLKPR